MHSLCTSDQPQGGLLGTARHQLAEPERPVYKVPDCQRGRWGLETFPRSCVPPQGDPRISFVYIDIYEFISVQRSTLETTTRKRDKVRSKVQAARGNGQGHGANGKAGASGNREGEVGRGSVRKEELGKV